MLPSIVALFWKTRLGLELVAPMLILEFGTPRETDSEPEVVFTAMSGLAVVEVASVQAYGVLLTMVEVELAVKLTRPPENESASDVESASVEVPETVVPPTLY